MAAAQPNVSAMKLMPLVPIPADVTSQGRRMWGFIIVTEQRLTVPLQIVQLLLLQLVVPIQPSVLLVCRLAPAHALLPACLSHLVLLTIVPLLYTVPLIVTAPVPEAV